MKFFVIATLLTMALVLSGCGAGVSVNTPLGGAGVNVGVGNVPPPVPFGR
jgi:hypothetical protein